MKDGIIKISVKGNDYIKTFKNENGAEDYYNDLSNRAIKSEENLIDNLIKDGFEIVEEAEKETGYEPVEKVDIENNEEESLSELNGRIFIDKNEIRVLFKYEDGDKSEIEYNKVFKNRKEAETYFNKNIDINRFNDLTDDESLSEYIYDLINDGFDLKEAKKIFFSPGIKSGKIFLENKKVLISFIDEFTGNEIGYLKTFKNAFESTDYYNNIGTDLTEDLIDNLIKGGFELI